jgi:hypothetical protein
MSEQILMKFIVGQRVVKEDEDSRFEGQVVACFVKRDMKTLRYVIENDDGVPAHRQRTAIAVAHAY